MNNLKKQLEKFLAKTNLANSIVGIALVVSLFYLFLNPMNSFAVLAACITGGFVNIANGYRQMKDPKRKTLGMSLIMMGIIIILLGLVVTEII